MTPRTGQIRRDFDRLALLPAPQWDPDQHYHSYLLGQIPQFSGRVLNVGSGRGLFSLKLASRAESVLGVDLSASMVRVARRRARDHAHVTFRVADVSQIELSAESFDVITSVATLHHLPFDRTLERLKCWLAPGGTLLILDLLDASGLRGALRSALALPAERILRLTKTGQFVADPEATRLWQLHETSDRYLNLLELEERVPELLPGATLRRHLFGRYSIRWQKPAV